MIGFSQSVTSSQVLCTQTFKNRLGKRKMGEAHDSELSSPLSQPLSLCDLLPALLSMM